MRVWFAVLFCIAMGFSAWSATPEFTLDAIHVANLQRTQTFSRSIYSLELQAIDSDTALFLRKPKGLHILALDSLNRHELQITFQIDSGFVDFDTYELAVMDSALEMKAKGAIDVWYAKSPRLDEIHIESSAGSAKDTLRLSKADKQFATLELVGHGLFSNTTLLFDDAAIQVNNSPGWQRAEPPHTLRVGLELDVPNMEVGPKAFRIRNPYAMEGFGTIQVIGAEPPQILSTVRGFVADGQPKTLELQGIGFSRGIAAKLIPQEGFVQTQYLSANKIQIDLTLPMLEQSKSYRIAVTNPDGQADTSAYFIARTTPLSSAKALPIDQQSIFRSKKVHVMFVVDTRDGWRLSRQQSYEVNIEGDRFPIVRVVNDSTAEAIIKLNDGEINSALNQHLFTINQVDRPARWRGIIKSRPAPQIYYISHNRILHPTDSLSLVIKGRHLHHASLFIEDPEVTFDVKENRGDLIRAVAVSGEHISFGSYPLEMRFEDVPFVFEEYRITLSPWQDYEDYVTFHITSLGDIPASQSFQGHGQYHNMNAQDAITVKFNTAKIKEEFGIQKVHISGVLTDSSNTIRAEAFDSRMITAGPGNEVITWRWRVRERIRSGDRIEITLKNPGNNNKITEFFVVEPHWSEAFHGSTSFILFKIPFGSNQDKTEILRSMALGISYQPFIKKDFLEFDASFIVGNAQSEQSNIAVEVSFGLSAIFWQHLQVGLGTNLTGGAFSKGFMFVGTRFKLPIPF